MISPAAPAETDGSPAPARSLRAGKRVLELGAVPLLMGIVNASPESFSDGGRRRTLADRARHAAELAEAGADIIDVGGESAVTGRPSLRAEEEIERVLPLIEAVDREVDALISVDTYKPAVAAAAIAAGASIVNDVSGLRDPELAALCASTGAALVVMHTRAAPKQRLHDPDLYGDVTADVLAFVSERMAVARAAGVADEQLIVDPGPDFTKTPAQTVVLLAQLPRLHALGRPVLMAISRKDFIGALTGRRPSERLAGTLAALAHGVQAGAHIFRLHDVAAAAEFLTVRAALSGARSVPPNLQLADELRHERPG